MRVFHVGIPNYALSKAFSEIGEYRYLDWTDYSAIPGNEGNLRRKTLEISNEFKPDLTFFQLQHPDPYDRVTMEQLSGFKVNFSWDVRDPLPKWFLNIAPGISLTCFTNEMDPEIMQGEGFNSEFLQSGFDDETFNPVGKVGEYPEILFMGNSYDTETFNFPLSGFREEMVNFLRDKYGDRFRVYGYGWKFRTDSFVHREGKESEAYRSCKIAINVSHYDRRRYTSDRILRLMGSGAFCLCKWYPDIEKDFVDGVHLRVWNTLEELDSLIKYYIDRPEERKTIADRGCELVRSEYTWKNMIDRIIEMKTKYERSK